jgi:mRNA interferase MazF
MARSDVIIVDIPTPSDHTEHEQIGSRPAVVVQSDVNDSNLPTAMIIPFTSNLQAMRFPHTIRVNPSALNGLSAPSVLLVFQLRAIDKSRIGRIVGRLEDFYMKQLEDEAKSLLGF